MLFIASDSSHMKAIKYEYCKEFQFTEHPELIHACIMVDKDTETNFYPQIISLTRDHDKLKPNCSFFGCKVEPQCCME